MRNLFVGILFTLPLTSMAYGVVLTDQSMPYETVPVESALGVEHFFLGELVGYPVMYEVVADEPFTFSAQVRQLSNKIQQPFSLILIRENDRGGGVREITRMNTAPKDWTSKHDRQIGLTFTQSPQISEVLDPGTYRIEISTPENKGKFMLQIGNESLDAGFTEQLQAVRTTQTFFGQSIFSMLRSSLIYYPLGILFLFFAFYKAWHYRNIFSSSKKHGPA